MGLIAKRLTAQNAVKLLAQFCEAHGPEVIRAAYGWEHAPVRRKSERFWAYYDPAASNPPDGAPPLVGWGAMAFDTRDADDDEAHLSVGVWPNFQRRGYRVAIYDHMTAQAKKMGADLVSLIVRKDNEAQYKRHMREAHMPGSEWIYAGDVWHPAPGYGYFVRPLA